MKIAITGASGFIGKLIYPKLIEANYDVVLVGRDQDKLATLFPGSVYYDYNALQQAFRGAQLVIHLAATNSDSKLPAIEFGRVNVDLMVSVAKAARGAKVNRFINISSFHAINETNNSNYANSKREGVKALNAIKWPAVEHVYLPIVYGEAWAGKLSLLNLLPLKLGQILFAPLAALKPTLNINYLVMHILSPPEFQMEVKEILLYDDKANNAYYSFIKRMLDISFVVIVVVFLSWLMLLVWISIRVTSKGPGIFVQKRVGKNRKVFKCYKFRTMEVGTRNVGTHDVAISSVTPLGAFLRKTKIDELPQIINIVRNELSLVGPRPCLPNQLELISKREARNVHSVKPGITGLSQIKNIDMSTPDKLSYWDARYIAIRGLLFDFKIIIATAAGNGQGDKIKS